jgi:predicted phage-related endonuclease
MQAALAFSPQTKAMLKVRLAETRASEEVQLAAKNKLTPEQGAALKQDFDHSFGAARETLKMLSIENPGAAKELEAVLKNSLDEHESALNRFAISSSTATSTAKEARAFADHIRNKARWFKDHEEEATSTPEDSSLDESKGEDDATSSSEED